MAGDSTAVARAREEEANVDGCFEKRDQLGVVEGDL
jgi:hypothetical protein